MVALITHVLFMAIVVQETFVPFLTWAVLTVRDVVKLAKFSSILSKCMSFERNILLVLFIVSGPGSSSICDGMYDKLVSRSVYGSTDHFMTNTWLSLHVNVTDSLGQE